MIDLEKALAYDVESFPNVFTIDMEFMNSPDRATWEISDFRDDRLELLHRFAWLQENRIPMIGFNNFSYDYPVIHFIYHNPGATAQQIYEFSMSIINSPFGSIDHIIWDKNHFAPQIDLFKLNHFHNQAKRTSLKALQINMRSPTVVECAIPFGTVLTKKDVEKEIIPYNIHDVRKTKEFGHFCMAAIVFRTSLIDQFGVDVMNWPDTKIGSRMMEDKIGQELCYEPAYKDADGTYHRKQMRQSPRSRIALKDIIFPYIRFENPEFDRVHKYFEGSVLTSQDLKEFGETAKVQTKGFFKDLHASVGGIEFGFGTGGIHASVDRQKIIATDDWHIIDIDVAQQYPQIAIQNNLYPEHLGRRFTEVYADLPKERKKWQKEKGKNCIEANALKLASNGVYGNSNSPFSPFYDPKYMLTTTINGQLSLCMLAEKLVTVPTLKMIQCNTDGMTFFIHKDHVHHVNTHCREWEKLTKLVLEDARYSRMWIRDVNNYIAESMDGSLKLKGAYWSPDALDYHNSISAAQPPAWHKDLSNVVSVRAAVAEMVHGVPCEDFIRLTTNPYDFMCRIKATKADHLKWGDEEIQKITRYHVSSAGRPLIIDRPPTGIEGYHKKANGIDKADYNRVMEETGGQWDARVCTKNKSTHQRRITKIQAGFNVQVCNDVKDFEFSTLNYDWYINEARKIIIS